MGFIRKALGTVALSATLACQNNSQVDQSNTSLSVDPYLSRLSDSLDARAEELARSIDSDSLTIHYFNQDEVGADVSLQTYFRQNIGIFSRQPEMQRLILEEYKLRLMRIENSLIMERIRERFESFKSRHEKLDSLASVYKILIYTAPDLETAKLLLREWGAENQKLREQYSNHN